MEGLFSFEFDLSRRPKDLQEHAIVFRKELERNNRSVIFDETQLDMSRGLFA